MPMTRLRGSSLCDTIRMPFLRFFKLRCGLPDRDRGEPASSVPSNPATVTSSSIAVSFSSASLLDFLRLRIAGLGMSSSSSSLEVLRLRNARDPSIGSSSRMRVLNTECDLGSMPPLAAGNKSRAILGADEWRRSRVSLTCRDSASTSNPFATQSLQRHTDTSEHSLLACLMFACLCHPLEQMQARSLIVCTI